MDQDMAIGSGQGLPVLAPVPAGLPADLLQRRPDILEAEHQLKAANADIGAARAAFFPKVTLTGSGGTVSQSVTGLFGAGQGAWSFAPQISLPIFSGGRLKGNLHYAQANRDIAVTTYEKAIQTAFREVADGLAARATFGSQLDAQRREVRSSQSYLDLATKAWRGGVSQYIVVLDAQRTVFSAQKQYLTDRLAQQTSEISLYRALGGGWTAGTPSPPVEPRSVRPAAAAFPAAYPPSQAQEARRLPGISPKSPFTESCSTDLSASLRDVTHSRLRAGPCTPRSLWRAKSVKVGDAIYWPSPVRLSWSGATAPPRWLRLPRWSGAPRGHFTAISPTRRPCSGPLCRICSTNISCRFSKFSKASRTRAWKTCWARSRSRSGASWCCPMRLPPIVWPWPRRPASRRWGAPSS
jgi:hypothetical protein